MHSVYNNCVRPPNTLFYYYFWSIDIYICMRIVKKNNTNPFSSEEETGVHYSSVRTH